MMNQIQKITITSGTPRKNSTYIVAGTRIHGVRASRARPTKMPSAKPSPMAGTASRSVPPAKVPMPISPCSTRNLKLLAMTVKSIVSAGRVVPGDEPGDGVVPLDAGHDRRDRQAQHQVDHGAGGQRLDGLGGVGLDLP